ncbi:MAG: hypothetical protein ACKOEO_04160 [Planctomycetaceae bacterium]
MHRKFRMPLNIRNPLLPTTLKCQRLKLRSLQTSRRDVGMTANTGSTRDLTQLHLALVLPMTTGTRLKMRLRQMHRRCLLLPRKLVPAIEEMTRSSVTRLTLLICY